ncbi:hypothetical protein SAMN04487781_4019 [Cellulosimicrobium cellulans]|nr:hypothetical protein SAMN04487781_4019 [Cellulosimicrobium cellulans]
MNEDLTTLTDDELQARRRALYALVQEPGCPRDVVLAFDAVTDEHQRRHGDMLERVRAAAVAAAKGPSIFEDQEQRAASEWA